MKVVFYSFLFFFFQFNLPANGTEESNSKFTNLCSKKFSSSLEYLHSKNTCNMAYDPRSDFKALNTELKNHIFTQKLFQKITHYMKSETNTVDAIKHCLRLQEHATRNHYEPEFCSNQNAKLKDFYNNPRPSCCKEILPEIRRKYAKDALLRRTFKAITNLSWPSFEVLKSANSENLMLKEFEQKNSTYAFSSDEVDFMKIMLKEEIEDLKTKGVSNYSSFKNQILLPDTLLGRDNDDELHTKLVPPKYQLPLKEEIDYFTEKSKSMNFILSLFLKKGLGSLTLRCHMLKFTPLASNALEDIMHETGDVSYCHVAEKIEKQCSDYEQKEFYSDFDEILSKWDKSVTDIPVVGQVISIVTVARDETQYNLLSPLFLYDLYQAEKVPLLKRFLKGFAVLPIKRADRLRETAGSVADTIQNNTLPELLHKPQNEILKMDTLDSQINSFAKKNALSIPSQIIYEDAIHKTAEQNLAAALKFQSVFNKCIESKIKTSGNIPSAIAKCRGF